MQTFSGKKKNVERIINDFTESKTRAAAFCNTLEVLQHELRMAETQEEFHITVQKLIDEGKKIHQFLSVPMNGADQEEALKVIAHLNRNSYFMTLLNYTEIVTKDIVAQKESLSLQELFSNLTEEQKGELLIFIQKLKELKPIAEQLIKQVHVFKDRLHQTNSLDVLDEIEDEIENKSQLLDGVLKRLIPYPQDELVAGKITDFLKINDHLLAVLQSFDLHESLMDDILHARATIMTKSSGPALGA